MNIEQQIESQLDNAYLLACNEVERLARKILVNHKNLDMFFMASGVYLFKHKNGDNVFTYVYKDINGSYCKVDTRKYFADLNRFIDKYDEKLGLRGTPMRFTAKGPKITNW